MFLRHAVPQRYKRYAKRLLRLARPQPPRGAIKRERVYAIGIYEGKSPFAFAPASRANNPVLSREDVTDVDAIAVADPFMLQAANRWYMFFEIYNRQTTRGQIGLATSEDGYRWSYERVVLDEPFHLSYPYVFEWQGSYYMLPECIETESLRLYQATQFPTHWSCVKTFMHDSVHVDPSIFHFNQKWWLFTCNGPMPFRADTLHLYYADTPLGPWCEHPRSPVISHDAYTARPAGRVVVQDDRIVRYSQDCRTAYGLLVSAFAITELTTTQYREHEMAATNPVLSGSRKGWNRGGMHHIDPHGLDARHFLACVDGWVMLEVKA